MNTMMIFKLRLMANTIFKIKSKVKCMIKLDRGFIADLGKIFTVLNKYFFLEELQVTMEEKMDTYGGDKEYVDAYILKFNYRDRNIRLATRGDGFVHTQVEGKPERAFDFDTGTEEKNEENIRAFTNWAQTNQMW